MNKLNIYISLILVCGIFIGFCFSQEINQREEITSPPAQIIYEEQELVIIPNSELDIINNCKNLSLRDSAYCLRDNIELFYNYTVTDDEIAENMTLAEIKELGGDCGTYSFLYKRLAISLGFNANTNNWKGLKDVYAGHRWATVWDNETYCRIDQLNVKCYEIKNE